MTLTANEVFRDFVTDGVPSSGAWKPLKKEIRALLAAMATGGATGLYDFIPASNTGAGTANAIKATTAVALPATPNGALVAVNVYADNTASPVTVQFNGGAVYTVKTNSGNDVAVGGLQAGLVAAGYISGTTFRLLSDQASAAIQAAAEAAAVAAAASAIAAAAYDPTYRYATPTLLLSSARASGGEGTVWQAGPYLYKEAAAGASDHDVTTAGGVKLYVQPDSIGAICPQQFGAVGNGTFSGAGTNDTAAVQKWGLSTRSKLKVLTACHLVTAAVRINIGDKIHSIGDGGLDGSTIADMGAAPALLYADGSANLVQLTTLASDRDAGSLTTPLTDASGIEVGDWYCLYNPTDYSWIGSGGGGRAYYREGEWLQAAKVSGNDVTPYRSLYYGYAAAAIQVWRLRGGGTEIIGGRYKPPYLQTAAIQIDCDVRPVVRDLRSDGSQNAGVRLTRCMDIDADLRINQMEDAGTPGDEYALVVANSSGGQVRGTFRSQRHGLAFGGGDYPCSVPNRDITVFVDTNSPRSQSLDVGGHGCSDRMTVVGGRHTGLITGGGNMTFIGAVFERGVTEDGLDPGVCVYASEICGGDHRFVGCTFKSLANAVNGFIQYYAQGGMRKKLRIFFDDCNFLDDAGNQQVGMLVFLSGSAYPVEVYINGGMVDMPSLTQLVRAQRSAGVATSKVVVDMVKNLAASVAVINAGAGLTLTTRVNAVDDPVTQGGSAVVNLAGTAYGTVAVTFPKPFTASPAFVPSVRDTVGSWRVTYNSLTATGATIRIDDVGGTARTGAVDVGWVAVGAV